MSALVELNGFIKADNGVYHAVGQDREFAYSDGEQTEVRLHQILSSASDLSSSSAELQSQISDWPTEYHLSLTRANLLRALDLSGVKRVLELGCGCGSISRYLGEQSELVVDSVEGSPSRAALAALRCKGLPNVTVCTANFNHIDFPEAYYDLVLFVGVTEYAGRFSEQRTDQEALQDLLSLSKRVAKPNGVTLVAIENRLGFKYLAGACEDHYAEPYVGLDNYSKSDGIRTYSRSEWQQQIAVAGFRHCDYIYPFPDYKIPTLLINDTALNANDRLNEAIQRISSRDYVANFDLGDKESYIWRGLLEAGTFADHSNSFLLLMSNDDVALSKMNDFSIVEYDVPELNYLKQIRARQGQTNSGLHKAEKVYSDANQEDGDLRKKIDKLSRHAVSLQQTIDIMSNSQGWRWLNRLRRLLGRPSIK